MLPLPIALSERQVGKPLSALQLTRIVLQKWQRDGWINYTEVSEVIDSCQRSLLGESLLNTTIDICMNSSNPSEFDRDFSAVISQIVTDPSGNNDTETFNSFSDSDEHVPEPVIDQIAIEVSDIKDKVYWALLYMQLYYGVEFYRSRVQHVRTTYPWVQFEELQ